MPPCRQHQAHILPRLFLKKKPPPVHMCLSFEGNIWWSHLFQMKSGKGKWGFLSGRTTKTEKRVHLLPVSRLRAGRRFHTMRQERGYKTLCSCGLPSLF